MGSLAHLKPFGGHPLDVSGRTPRVSWYTVLPILSYFGKRLTCGCPSSLPV